MATTTTNFGWDIPQSTDLVKDGATAIAALGQDIDTALVDLKGGTTGQVLAKASNTDLDYSWVAQDDSNAIQNAIVDAKGDLIAASAADTPARLAVGNNGETLVADSSTSTGLRWQGSQAAGKNYVINGDFDIWQRGTSTTTNANYGSADRWWMYYGAGTSTFSRESTIVPTGSTYSLKIAQSVATNTNLQINQSIESLNAVAMAGKTVTISGLFAASASTTLIIDVVYSTSTDVAPGGSWTAATVVTSGTGTVSTTASFSRITGVYTIPSTAKSVMARIISTSVTSGTNVYVSQVQLEIGNVPTTFTPAGGTIQGELAACQRYYIRTTSTGTDSNHGIGLANSTTTAYIHANITEMRVIPTSVDYANLNVSDSVNNFTFSGLSINSANSTPRLAFLIATGASGMTQFRPLFMRNNNNTSGYIGFSAEL